MSSQVIVAILGTSGFSVIIGAIITAIASKRKIGAEATDIITKAAAGVVTNMQGEIDRQVKRNDEMVAEHKAQMKAIVDSHEKEMNEVRRVLQLHVAWDVIAIDRVNELSKVIEGIDPLPPAPPLLPASSIAHPEW